MKRPPLFLMLLLATLADSQMAGACDEAVLAEGGLASGSPDQAQGEALGTAEALLNARIKSAA